MARLTGKRALITGGTTGIGLATARLFMAEGARVAITGQNPERLDDARRELGPDVLAIRADAGKVGDAVALMAELGQSFDGLDVLFLNAGIANFVPLEQVTEAFFDQTFDVNVKGVLFTVQAAGPLLRSGGSVIVTTSISNTMGLAGSSVYAASKAAARSLVRAIAAELLPRGIRVNAISPGPIETPIMGKSGMSPEQLQGMVTMLTGNVPMGRMGQADEVAKTALFLASDDSSFIVGAEIIVDGGWSEVRA